MIYKYLTVNAARAVLANHSLRASTAKNFNDPFELAINSRDETFRNLYGNANKLTEIREILAKKKLIKAKLATSRIVCFSRTKREILMWSHYAEHHKGVVLGFDEKLIFSSEQNSQKPFEMLDVLYCNDLVVDDDIFGFDNYEDALKHSLRTKYKAWNYEEEVRAIFNLNDSRYTSITDSNIEGVSFVQFDPSSIAEVILGCKISDDDKVAITKHLDKYPNAGVDIATMSKEEYRLNLEGNSIDEEPENEFNSQLSDLQVTE